MTRSAGTVGDIAVSTVFIVLKHEPYHSTLRLLNTWLFPGEVVVVLALKGIDRERWAFVLVSGRTG